MANELTSSAMLQQRQPVRSQPAADLVLPSRLYHANGVIDILLIHDKKHIYHRQAKKCRGICAKLNYACDDSPK